MPPRPPAAPPPHSHAHLHSHPHSHTHAHAHRSHNHPRSPNEHLIQFYNGEESLFDAISSFILPSFFSNEHAAVIVATKSHLEALDLYLRQQNLVPELLRKREQMFLAPAELILEQLMPNGIVEKKIFFDYFGPLFGKLQKRYPRLLVYGELVNILCENGEHEKAHELEEVWEAFLAGKDAALLCGYSLNVFSSDGLEDVFQRICRSHSQVTPAEDTKGRRALGRPEDQPMVLAMLQQKNLRLEAEMGRRAAVEAALRATLDHLGSRPTEAVQVRERDGATTHISLSPVGIMAATTIEGVTDYFFNERFLELSGLTSKSVRLDPGWVGAVHYQDRERVSHNIRLVDGKSRRLEYRFVLGDGSIRWVVGESVSKESGYVHSAVDISQLRNESPSPSVKPRAGPLAHGVSGEPSGRVSPVGPPGAGWKRSIGFSRISSPSGPSHTSVQPNSIFTRTHPNDPKIAQELMKVTQLLWENLFPHPPLLHPSSPDPTQSNISTRLSTLYKWYRSQPRFFVPDTSPFDINNDALQKANIRLAHIAYYGSIIMLSRYPVVRALERGDLPRRSAPLRRDGTPGHRKNELDDLQYAEGCIDAAVNAISHCHVLVSPIPPSSSATPPLAAFSDHESDFRDARSCRTVLGVLFAASLTVLLSLSLYAEGAPEARRHDGILHRISRTIDDLHGLPETLDAARRCRAMLGPFISVLSARHHIRPSISYSTTNSNSGPQSAYGKRLTNDIANLLKHPMAGTEWLPFNSPLWCWRDLLVAPGAPPVGGRMTGDAAKTPSLMERTLRDDGASSPPREKRARTTSDEVEAQWGGGETGEQWSRRQAVSKELEALFKRKNSSL